MPVCSEMFLQGLLTALTELQLDGNNMPHLALPPLFKTDDGKDHSRYWVKRWRNDCGREVRLNSCSTSDSVRIVSGKAA